MGFEFEQFEAAGSSFTPKITVRSNGAIGFSQGALNRFNLGDGEWFVQLFFDKKQQVIGIKPTREGTGKGSLRLAKKEVKNKDGKSSYNSFVSAKSFMDFYGIDYKESRSFLGEWWEEGSMIIVKLGKMGASSIDDGSAP